MKKILFKHELKDAWEMPINSITIIDDTINNVIINKRKLSIPTKAIDDIKELLNNDKLYSNKNILFPPILDGTSHKIILSNVKKKEINCFNLWYWNKKGIFDNLSKDVNKEDIKYTKLIINLVNNIQKILNNNNVKIYIINDSDDYEN